MQNFEKIIKLLIDNEVKFVFIGGFAATVHGASILTQDIDVCISFDEENMRRILNALKDINPIHRANKQPLGKTASSLTKFKNLYLLTDIGSIDLIGKVSGIGSYPDLLAHSIEIDLFGRKCKVLDIDGLIRSKREMGRSKDKETIIQLEAIKERLEND